METKRSYFPILGIKQLDAVVDGRLFSLAWQVKAALLINCAGV